MGDGISERLTFEWAAKIVRLENEIERLKAIVDAIPGDDKRLVAKWAVTIAAEELLLRDACPNHDEGFTTAVLTCPSSVRAALRSNEVQS